MTSTPEQKPLLIAGSEGPVYTQTDDRPPSDFWLLRQALAEKAEFARDDRLREAIHFFVIPGRAEREPGIHKNGRVNGTGAPASRNINVRGYGFRARAKQGARPGMTAMDCVG